jgi:hypothetical protein
VPSAAAAAQAVLVRLLLYHEVPLLASDTANRLKLHRNWTGGRRSHLSEVATIMLKRHFNSTTSTKKMDL